MYSSDELFQRSQDGYFGVYFPTSQLGNKHQNDTRVRAETVFHESTYIILFITRHNNDKSDDKNDDLHTSTPCVTHNRLLMMSQ